MYVCVWTVSILGGVFSNFGFGGWKFGYSETSNLDLVTKVANLDLDLDLKLEIWIWGGYSPTSDLDLGKKVVKCVMCGGGVFCNFGFGLRKKSWTIWIFGFASNIGFGLKVEFSLGGGGGEGGYSETEKSQRCQHLLKVEFSFGGGYSETEKSQSANICLKLNFPGGGGGYSETVLENRGIL